MEADDLSTDLSTLLRQYMQQANIDSYRSLSRQAEVSLWQVTQLRRGHLAQMRIGPLQQISQTLNISLGELIQAFTPLASALASGKSQGAIAQQTQQTETTDCQPSRHAPELTAQAKRIQTLEQEYAQLQTQLAQQQITLEAKFCRDSLHQLESWLTYWPAATQSVQQGQAVSPEALIRLVRPVEQLMATWGLQPIGSVGATVAFDPQQHQLSGANGTPGQSVRIKTIGYWFKDKLLFRAKCVPLA